MTTRYGKSTARGYNAPCYAGVVHYYWGSILMRWHTADGKDRIALLSQKLSCSTLYHFSNHLQLFFSIDCILNIIYIWGQKFTCSKLVYGISNGQVPAFCFSDSRFSSNISAVLSIFSRKHSQYTINLYRKKPSGTQLGGFWPLFLPAWSGQRNAFTANVQRANPEDLFLLPCHGQLQ